MLTTCAWAGLGEVLGASGCWCSRCPSFFFTRANGTGKTEVIAAFRFDWYGKEIDGSLERNWFGGGKVRITKLVRLPRRERYDYRGTKGNKLDWEMCRWASISSIPGSFPATPCAT